MVQTSLDMFFAPPFIDKGGKSRLLLDRIKRRRCSDFLQIAVRHVSVDSEFEVAQATSEETGLRRSRRATGVQEVLPEAAFNASRGNTCG